MHDSRLIGLREPIINVTNLCHHVSIVGFPFFDPLTKNLVVSALAKVRHTEGGSWKFICKVRHTWWQLVTRSIHKHKLLQSCIKSYDGAHDMVLRCSIQRVRWEQHIKKNQENNWIQARNQNTDAVNSPKYFGGVFPNRYCGRTALFRCPHYPVWSGLFGVVCVPHLILENYVWRHHVNIHTHTHTHTQT